MKKIHPSILTVFVMLLIALGFAALLEVGAAMCFPAKTFALYGLFWILLAGPFVLYKPANLKTGLVLLFIVGLVLLWGVNWNSRKSFLRDLAKIQPGMTREQVEGIMGKYMTGTGLKLPPDGPNPGESTLTEVSTGQTMKTTVSADGELAIKDAVTYRHSEEGCFNADWGVVSFENGRVVSTTFMPD